MPPAKEAKPLTKEEKKALAEAEAAKAAEEAARVAAELAARLAAEKAARQVAWAKARAEELVDFQSQCAAAVERTAKHCAALQSTPLGAWAGRALPPASRRFSPLLLFTSPSCCLSPSAHAAWGRVLGKDEGSIAGDERALLRLENLPT